MDRRWLGSWLAGPSSAEDGAPGKYPGERLGLPQEGPGSIAGLGRRLGGLLIDWLICSVIGLGLLRSVPFAALLVFAVENVLLVGTAGFTIGHRIVGIRVSRVDGSHAGFGWAAVRTVFLCVFIPALFMDRDLRGMHDRAADTVPVRI
ncbi:MAG: RDD family protein [Streptosporangiales bacterium]|nr:RDD family protein [Streptosporangiales bacterium]MBO0890194.1 RDD family protein [Acidothermales bacterium]